MRTLLRLTVLLGVLGNASLANACKCGDVSMRELDELYTVFVGTAVESLQRTDVGGIPGQPGPRVNAATRFEVRYSRDLPIGSSVVVAMDLYTSCSTFFAVGERHLVPAFKLGELLYAEECPILLDGLEQKVLARLGVPAGFLERRTARRDEDPSRCAHPSSLDRAFEAADVVGWWDSKASCLVPGSDVVEHSAAMRWGWKGLRQGDALRVRVVRHTAERAPLDLESALSEATNMRWPPADFLRREGDVFIDDGCLSPLPPPSLEAGTEALLRLVPLPDDYPRRHFPEKPPFPAPSCMTLDDSYFSRADAAVARYREEREASHGGELRGAATSARQRGGAHAGCSAAPRSERASVASWAWALAYLVRTRRRRCGVRSI